MTKRRQMWFGGVLPHALLNLRVSLCVLLLIEWYIRAPLNHQYNANQELNESFKIEGKALDRATKCNQASVWTYEPRRTIPYWPRLYTTLLGSSGHRQ